MEEKRKYIIIGIVVVLLGIFIMIAYPKNKTPEQNRVPSHVIPEEKKEELEKVPVTGYHLVTYAQSAHSNSFLQSLTVTATNRAKVRFVMGTIDENSVVQERNSFEMECKEGENTFDLLKERYVLKEGEYLFMDISGQDILYTKQGETAKSLVQNEATKVSGKMIMTESDYILPFHYELQKVKNYHALVLGNDITTQNGGKGLQATEENLDYYSITKARLENTFETVKMNRIYASQWEKASNKKEWLANLKKEDLTDLDLVIFQLGDYYVQETSLEADITDLVKQIRLFSPNAEMVWIGLWNQNEKMLNALPGICERLNIEFINISDLNQPDYQASVIENLDGVEKEVFYPNNEAMQIISNRVVEKLGFSLEME